ncbi:MAG: hypothetical protein LBK68_07340, partial [Candidatus Margulisbacteria bacterium]|nr:hypothetical protein [Candidatus Margulisiibacteriota bacterium]
FPLLSLREKDTRVKPNFSATAPTFNPLAPNSALIRCVVFIDSFVSLFSASVNDFISIVKNNNKKDLTIDTFNATLVS